MKKLYVLSAKDRLALNHFRHLHSFTFFPEFIFTDEPGNRKRGYKIESRRDLFKEREHTPEYAQLSAKKKEKYDG